MAAVVGRLLPLSLRWSAASRPLRRPRSWAGPQGGAVFDINHGLDVLPPRPGPIGIAPPARIRRETAPTIRESRRTWTVFAQNHPCMHSHSPSTCLGAPTATCSNARYFPSMRRPVTTGAQVRDTLHPAPPSTPIYLREIARGLGPSRSQCTHMSCVRQQGTRAFGPHGRAMAALWPLSGTSGPLSHTHPVFRLKRLRRCHILAQ
jgi:hypothetical protein